MGVRQVLCTVCNCGIDSCETCTRKSECKNCNSMECCCERTHIQWHKDQVRKGVFLEYFSLGWMTVEVVASIVAGLIIGRSIALLAFGGDSVIELISAYAVLTFMRNLNKDGAAEVESERTEKFALSLLVLLVPVIAGVATYSYFSDVKPEASLLGIAVAFGAVVIMPILWIQKRKIGREADVVPIRIDAAESATCFFMSLALLGGLVINYFFHLILADYVATAVILGFVVLEIKESLEEMRAT